ncbi:EpsG family protein [Tolumonas osonensis]|uniref:EpsG family protein n=1 Tax=Tolumonas osonensis TaxID=675874 RepID=A0A841GC20_9GAMM|nr:hypothetical protein [Tolumonas osonensis]
MIPYKKNTSCLPVEFWLGVSFVFSVLFVILSCYWSKNVNYINDTLEYKYNFDSIHVDIYPYGVEFLTSLFMYIVSVFGGDFSDFILFSYLMWLPIVFLCVNAAGKNITYFFVSIFLLSTFFYLNASYLIRQYYAASFFVLYIFLSNRKKISYVFLFASLFSHLSSIIWILTSSAFAVKLCKSRFVIFAFAFFSFFSLTGISIYGFFVEALMHVEVIFNLPVLTRKIMFYTGGEAELASSVNVRFTVFSILIFIMSAFLMHSKCTLSLLDEKICSLIMYQSLFIIVFNENIVLANRVGFFVFFFSIPCFLILIGYYLRRQLHDI